MTTTSFTSTFSPTGHGTSSSSGLTTNVVDNDSNFRLGCLTDVEGNVDYFIRFVQQSNVLDLPEKNPTSTIVAANPCPCRCVRIVISFTAVTQLTRVWYYTGDIRRLQALCALKRQYPQRVYLTCWSGSRIVI
eukprot:scaffold5783_cov129-Amphora_coffeaeformis.AAC.9